MKKLFCLATLMLMIVFSAWAEDTKSENYRMGWRGLLLDSGRQYQTVEYIESLLDAMQERNMNVFHWHLTETDGWRMQLPNYPKLTEVGGSVATGQEQQGFYTVDEMKHIIDYAQKRGIMVVPEIDLPGHSGALIAAYPDFGCSSEVVCPANAQLLDFLKGVIDDVCTIFPSEYIHLGGDEVNQNVWTNCADCQQLMQKEGIASAAALQVWFERQLIEYLGTKGRKAILWEDVLYETSAPLPDNVVIQWWNYRSKGETGLKEALKRGLPVICSSNYYCYLNFPETPWGGYAQDRTCTAADIENRNPSNKLFDAENPLMLGMEACLWTDYNLTQDLLNTRLFPRLDILARQMREADPEPQKKHRKAPSETESLYPKASSETEKHYYRIVWHKDGSGYLTEKEEGAMQAQSKSTSQKQYWLFVPTENEHCYYIQNAVTGHYIGACKTSKDDTYSISTGNTAVEYYLSPESAQNNAFRITSTNCPNYNDTSQTPVGLNKSGKDNSIITWDAGTGNAGSYWDLEETEFDYEDTPSGLGGTDKYYYIVWHNNSSSYITEKAGNTLQVEGQNKIQKQYWQLIPTTKENCYYIKNAVTGHYIEACKTTSNNTYNIGVVDTPIEYYISQEEAVGGAYRLTSTNCSNYSDTSKSPVGLNKNGANSSIITWAAGTNNSGSYWDISETPFDYDYEGAAALTRHSDFAKQAQVYFMPCGSFLATYCAKKLKLTGEGCAKELDYPCSTWGGASKVTGTANTSSWWTLYTTDKGKVVPGGKIEVEVTLAAAPPTGYLAQVCFDWNHDGVFEDVQTIEEPQSKSLSFSTTVPLDAKMGESRMRFRLTESGDPEPEAEVAGGQILDCIIWTVPEEEVLVSVSVNDATRGSAYFDEELGKAIAIPCGDAKFLCWTEGKKVVSTLASHTVALGRPRHLVAVFSVNTTDERPATGVRTINSDAPYSTPIFYDLSGRQVISPEKGKTYIRKDSPLKGKVINY